MTPDIQARPLDGVRVIDLTTVIFGPYATQTLADYGADVVKIEAPAGDSTRFTGAGADAAMGSLFVGANRGKRSVVLDLKSPRDLDAFLRLCETADVFVHNVRPAALARLGVTAEVLARVNPRLIQAQLTGFGSTGPYAGQAAYDDIVQALSGAADLVRRQTGTPGYFPTVFADKIAAQMAVHAVMGALLLRARTGRGHCVEVPMYEAVTSFLLVEHFHARHFSDADAASATAAPAPGALGYPRTLAASRRPYRTTDGHVCVMPYTDENWRRFGDAVGAPDLLDDPRFRGIAQRTRHIDSLLGWLSDIVATRPTRHWVELCRAHDIPCAPIHRLEDLERDPHLRAVGLFDAPRPAGAPRGLRSPVMLDGRGLCSGPPPRLGEHTAQVLAEIAAPR